MALLQGKSIKDLVIDKVFEGTDEEEAAWAQLMKLLEDRIIAAEKGEVSKRTLDDIANDVLNRNGYPNARL